MDKKPSSTEKRKAEALDRRSFLKTSSISGGAAFASTLFLKPLDTLTTAAGLSAAVDDEWVPTTCWIGKQDCGMLARRVNGRVVSLVGQPEHPRNRGKLCPKGAGQLMAMYDPNRVKAPLIRTNEKGVSGEWKQVSWDEALKLVAKEMNAVLKKDPNLLVWQKGRSKAKSFYDKAFVNTTGAIKLHHGAMCSDAGYRALEYTIGTHAVLHPDFRSTNYLLAWGWNATAGGGNKTCWLTWPQQMVEAKERGMKIVSIDPRRRASAHFADEWLPIRPGTDMALALAICNQLIQQGTIDESYLKTYTNAPYLVGEDGRFLRSQPEGEEEPKELVWDSATSSAVPVGTEGSDPALDGEYVVDGAKAKTSFQLFKDHIAEYTVEWAADLTGLPVGQISNIARELGENAMIGETVNVDGITIPYRPVAIMTYHIAQQELGFQTIRAISMISMLLGAFGAVGGQLSDYTWKIHKNYKELDSISITESPNIYLNKSKFYPINSNNSSLVAKVMVDPDKYGVETVPEMAILHMVNPLGSFPDRDANAKAYELFKFVAVLDPWLSLTADLYADVVLPTATLNKYEGPISATDQYIGATAMRIPPMDPLFDTRGEIDIYMDLCEEAGLLFGDDGYLAQVNSALKLKDEFAIPTDTKPTVREIFDLWARSAGIEDGIVYFEENGVLVSGPVSPEKRYGYASDPPFGGALHRLYGESLLGYQEEMKSLGSEQIYWQDYTALPTWRTLTAEGSPEKYDLYLISYHMIEFKQSRTPIPLMLELSPHQVLEMNPQAGEARGIKDGDEVWVESQNALTGETRLIKVETRFREGIRPDTVAMPHHYGEYVKHPWVKGSGPTPNSIFFTGEGYVANTADQTFQVKVRVYKE